MVEATGPSAGTKHPAFDFLLRHVDDAPNIGHSRFQRDVVKRVSETALGFAIVGEIRGAMKLLFTLRSHGIDFFDQDVNEYALFLKPCMYFAWEATSSWPDWVSQDERAEENLRKLEEQGRDPWLERFSDDWVVDSETAKKGLVLADGGLCAALPDLPMAQKVAVIDQWWKEGRFPYAASPLGPMSVRYSEISLSWRMGTYPYPYMQLFRSAGLVIALDIYLRLGHEQEAQDVLQRVCQRFTYTEQAEMLSCSRAVWKNFLVGPSPLILEHLDIDTVKMRGAVSRSASLLEARLTRGPSRPFRDKTLEQLVHLVSAHTSKNCPYDTFDLYRPSPRQRPQDDKGLLREPCTSAEIVQLESRLGVSLPQDYKDFLSITNGTDPVWNGSHLLNFFARADEVDYFDTDYLRGVELNIVRDNDPPARAGNRLDWPKIAHELTVHGITVSGGGTGGELWLIKPEMTKQLKDFFFSTYQVRGKEQQRELGRVIDETYGSRQVFEALEWALVSWTAWEFEMVPYAGMRNLFERLAEQSMRTERYWSRIFEPDFRRISDE